MSLQKLAEQRKAANTAVDHPEHNIKQTMRRKVRNLKSCKFKVLEA